MPQSPAPVLVVDDSPEVREGLAALLGEEGFDVVTAEHGQQALEMLGAGLRPCIIIMDLMMPVMNGFEFRQAQLRDRSIAHIPVIACSGMADAARGADHLRASACVQKPADVRNLIALVRQHCLKPGLQPLH